MKYFLNNPLEVLYEDDDVIVVNKPSGVLTTATARYRDKNLTNIVNHQFLKSEEAHLHPCHRLDKDTSGAIIYAKGKSRQQKMMDLFKAKQIEKTYIAFVKGHFKQKSGEIKFKIVEGRPQAALTTYNVLEEKELFSVLEINPQTGRRNQIRIHMNQIGHPLIGDRKFYFGRNQKVKFKRTALHAAGLKWESPFSKKRIEVKCELAEDMRSLLK